MQPQTFVFFGIVGSGKGTQVKLLTDFLKEKDGRDLVYIGTGEIFRQLMDLDNEDARFLGQKMSEGELITDDFTNRSVSDALKTKFSTEKHLIFDGYPRTVPQSVVFEDMMNSFKRGEVKIIYIEVGKEEAMKRNLLRGRHDDTEAGLAKRFDEYINNVVPAMNYFRNKNNYQIYTINGEQSVENVHKEIISKLGY